MANSGLALGQRSAMRPDNRGDLFSRSIRREQQSRSEHQLVGRRCTGVTEQLEQVPRAAERVGDETARDDWTNRMQIEFEPGCDAEVAAPATDRPEQIRV